MKIKTIHVAELLRQISLKTKLPLNYNGYGKMEEKFGGTIRQKYLYESLHNGLASAKQARKKEMALNDTKLDELAVFLDYEGIDDFIQSQETQQDPRLASLVGTYYSYVRRNQEQGMLFRSPVRIFEHEGRIVSELKGGRFIYTAMVSIQLDCIFIPFQTTEGKAFYHIYKGGKINSPAVLQGCFSGVSNGLQPIAGRAVLIRMNENYKDLKNDELRISELSRSRSLEHRRLAEYFKTYEENNLKIIAPYSFTLNDLGTCK